jgi:hypothetical protein
VNVDFDFHYVFRKNKTEQKCLCVLKGYLKELKIERVPPSSILPIQETFYSPKEVCIFCYPNRTHMIDMKYMFVCPRYCKRARFGREIMASRFLER